MVNNHTTHQAGDMLLFQAGPLAGVVELSSYSETIGGADSQAQLAGEFRVSAHGGLYYNDWQPLSPAALFNATRSPDGQPRTLFLEFRYVHQGAPQPLTFNRLQLGGRYQDEPLHPVRADLAPALRALIGTPEHEALCAALLRKLHAPGILPAYIDRGATATEATGFLALWGTDACFYAAIMLLARRLGRAQLLDEFLRQRGLHFAPGTLSRFHAEQLRGSFYDRMRQRGTAAMFEPGAPEGPAAGEFRLLVGAPDHEPVAWALTAPVASGWVVGSTSPLSGDSVHAALRQSYGGARFPSLPNLPRGPRPEQVRLTETVVGANQARNAPPGGLVVTFAEVELLPGQTVARLTADTNVFIGLQHPEGLAQPALTVAIDPAFDYEVSWLVRQASPDTCRLRFGVQGFDAQRNRRPLLNPAGRRTEYCTPNVQLPAGQWVWVSCPVYAAGTDPSTVPTTLPRLGVGNVLLNPGQVTQLCPTVELRLRTGQTVPATLDVAAVEVRPLATGAHLRPRRDALGTPASAAAELGGFVSAAPWLLVYYRNHNATRSAGEIATIVRRQLAPAGAEVLLIEAQDNLVS